MDTGKATYVKLNNDDESGPSIYREHRDQSETQIQGCDNACLGDGDCCSKEKDGCCDSDDDCCSKEKDGCCSPDGEFCHKGKDSCSDCDDDCGIKEKDGCCGKEKDGCCGSDLECGGKEKNGCCNSDRRCSDDDDTCGNRDQGDCLGDGSCCEPDEGRVDGDDGQNKKEQVRRSIVSTKCYECDDEQQTIRTPSNAEKLVTCVSGREAPIRHKILRLRPNSDKRKISNCCDDQCVCLLAKGLCQKECHTETGVCASHESVAKHYSSFLVEKREILWRCICSLMRQLEVPGACCRKNDSPLSTGPRYSFLYPSSATATPTSNGQHNPPHHDGQVQVRIAHGRDKDREPEKKTSNALSATGFALDNDPEGGLVPENLSKKAVLAFEKIMGVTNVWVNFLFEKAQLEYYPSLTSPKQICADLQRATGFKASTLRTDGDAFYFISGKSCSGDGVEMLPDNSWKVVYDLSITCARDTMTALGLEISDILPALQLDEVTRKIFGMTIDREIMQQCGSFVVALILTIPILVLSWCSFKPSIDLSRSIVCLVLATIIQIVCARKIYVSVYYTVAQSYDLDADCLVALSTSVAYLYSVVIFGLHRHGILLSEADVYESSSLLLTLVLFSKVISTFIRRLGADQLKFDVFQPTTMKLEELGMKLSLHHFFNIMITSS
ncbi:hypothetical protein V1504DRAFT_436813 [Lipomyces starkeyi]